MKIVIDTNRIIAALVKKGTTRSILFDAAFDFITPDYTMSEIMEYEGDLRKKTNLTLDEFGILVALLLEHVTIIPGADYEKHLGPCQNDISDKDDVPILAVALATGAEGIWTHDPHFQEQRKAKVFTNYDLLKMSGKIKG